MVPIPLEVGATHKPALDSLSRAGRKLLFTPSFGLLTAAIGTVEPGGDLPVMVVEVVPFHTLVSAALDGGAHFWEHMMSIPPIVDTINLKD